MAAAEKQRLLKLSDELHGLIAGLVVEGPSLPSVSSRRTPEIPSDLLKRASDIQKRLKRTDKGGCLLKGESSTVPVTFFSMKKKNKVYVKDGLAIEVMVDRDIGYDDLVEVGSKALEVPEIPDQSRMAALFTSGGALIQSVDNWSLSYYMKQHHRGPGKIRVGIGYIEVAKSSPKQPASSSSSELVPSEPEVDLTNSVDASGLDTVIVDFDSEENNGAGVDSRKRRCEARPVGSTKRPKIGNSSIVGPRKTRAGNTVEKPQSTLCMEFFAQELAEATKNYSRSTVLGRGGYGTVFRGFLRHSDVAVKVLTQDGKDAFTKEVSALGRFRHPNILQMFGFCTKPSALVFEFMSQGSLYDKLHVDKSSELDWRRRHSILQGCCKGIVYLHTASPPMIHQDVKSANILLDEMYRPKLGDFGFSLELPHITSGHTLFTAKFVARSEGYYPSELSSGKLSDRTDVYSFGVVVLETFCGLLAFDSKREDQKLVDYLQDDLSSESRFARLHDDKLEAPSNAMVSLMFHVVTMCLKRHSVRPKASEVLNMLEL